MGTRRVWVTRRNVLATALALAACSSDTSAPPDSNDVFDLQTHFQSFSLETAAPSPPDCPDIYTNYCTHTRPFDGASLVGTIEVTSGRFIGTSDRLSARLGGLFCSQWALTGCITVKAIPTADYLGYSNGDVGGGFYIQLRVGAEGELVTLRGKASADSLFGTVQWSQSIGRSPPTHQGTFVARLRR